MDKLTKELIKQEKKLSFGIGLFVGTVIGVVTITLTMLCYDIL